MKAMESPAARAVAPDPVHLFKAGLIATSQARIFFSVISFLLSTAPPPCPSFSFFIQLCVAIYSDLATLVQSQLALRATSPQVVIFLWHTALSDSTLLRQVLLVFSRAADLTLLSAFFFSSFWAASSFLSQTLFALRAVAPHLATLLKYPKSLILVPSFLLGLADLSPILL